ncbi:NB-ARC domain-containing protein [Ancylothrix sp. D3o]|uniref:NB-ARC domain-containing protein n=1 Tax=Ancylothrix sp. D3o TaxID=2953691 RepID=UPI0021BB8D66|nr:NB-ARC domain-containing protein [Ancylothrix sp. D3o]
MADALVFAKTGQYLDDLQKAILRGTLQGEKYSKIAQEKHCNESYVRDVGAKLWETLSKELGEKLTKSNFRSTMERLQISIVSHLEPHHNQISNVNICGEARQPPDTPNPNPKNKETSNPQQTPNLYHDLTEMPKLGNFYNRTGELESLKTSILTEKAQLLTITGMIGMGKTAVAIKLVEDVKHEFEYVIWRSLETCPTVSQLQTNLTDFFTEAGNQTSPLPLMKSLQNHRCLIILDDIHYLFRRGELAGQYQPGYEDYRSFFKQIKERSHQSCFLLIGWEAPREISQIKNPNTPNLILIGLDTASAHQIIAEQGLESDENCLGFIDYYQGNPLWLKTVANFLAELGLTVTEMLQSQPFLLPQYLQDILEQPLAWLSEREKQLLSLLAKEDEPLALAKLLEIARMPSSDLLDSLQSLYRRCWVEKTGHIYMISPLLRQYIGLRNRLS